MSPTGRQEEQVSEQQLPYHDADGKEDDGDRQDVGVHEELDYFLLTTGHHVSTHQQLLLS